MLQKSDSSLLFGLRVTEALRETGNTFGICRIRESDFPVDGNAIRAHPDFHPKRIFQVDGIVVLQTHQNQLDIEVLQRAIAAATAGKEYVQLARMRFC